MKRLLNVSRESSPAANVGAGSATAAFQKALNSSARRMIIERLSGHLEDMQRQRRLIRELIQA